MSDVVMLTFRCAKQRADQARARVRSEDRALSTVLRSLLYAYLDGQNASPQIARAATRLAAEVRRVGINLNQIAHSLNAGIVDAPLVPDLVRHLARLSAALRDIQHLLLARRSPISPSVPSGPAIS